MHQQEKQAFQKGHVFTVSLAHLIHDIYSSFLAPLLPLIIEKLSISYSVAGSLPLYQRIVSLFNPLIGLAADKIAMRYVLIIAPSITAVSMSLIGIADSYIFLVILLFISGIGVALFHVPGPVMIKRVSGEQIGKGMSWFMLGGELARTVGPLVIAYAVSVWTLEGTWRLFTFGLAASGLLYFRLRKIKISDAFKEKQKSESAGDTIKKFTPFFISSAGAVFFSSLMKGGITIFLPTYLTTQGMSVTEASIYLSAVQLIGAASVFIAGNLSDKIGRKNMLIFQAVAQPVLFFLFAATDGYIRAGILVMLSLVTFITNPVLLAIVNKLKSARPAFLNGIFMGMNFIVPSLSAITIGLIGDTFGMDTGYKVIAGFGIIALPFILSLKSEETG